MSYVAPAVPGQVARACLQIGSYVQSNSYTGQMPSVLLVARNSKGKTSQDVEQRGLG
jgi:hypothetical protein